MPVAAIVTPRSRFGLQTGKGRDALMPLESIRMSRNWQRWFGPVYEGALSASITIRGSSLLRDPRHDVALLFTVPGPRARTVSLQDRPVSIGAVWRRRKTR